MLEYDEDESIEQDDEEELPIAPNPNIKFWKDVAKGILVGSVKSIEEVAKQIFTVSCILSGIYFHSMVSSDLQGDLGNKWLLLFLLPPIFWFISVFFALLALIPRSYESNISSWRASKDAFESIVYYKRLRVRVAGVFLVIGVSAMLIVVLIYLVE